MAEKAKRIDIVNGPMVPNIFRFILPLIATGVLQLLYNAADNVVVGRFDGSVALAAVGSTGPLVNLLLNICMGFSVGSSVAVAHAYGAGDHEGVQKVIHTSVLLSLVGGFVVSIVGLLFAEPLLVLMDSPEDVLPLSVLYLRIFFLGTPASMVYNFCASMLRSLGDTKRPLYYLTISGLINVGLNLIFVIVFHMGVAGVALATIISQYVSMLLIVLYMMRQRDVSRLELRRLRFHPEQLRRILRIGFPAGLQGSVFSLSNVVIQSAVNSFDSAIIMAGNTAAGNLEGFVYVAMNAVHHAALTFTGQNLGARRYDKLRRVMWSSVLIVTGIGFVFGMLIFLCGDFLLGIYLPDDPEAIVHGIRRMSIVATTYFLCGIMDVMVGAQRGLGLSFTPMVVSMLGACGLRILWIYTAFAIEPTLFMLYLSYPISWFVTSAVHMIVYAAYYRRMMRQYAGEPLA